MARSPGFLIALAFTAFGCTAAQLPSIEAIRAWEARVVRVQGIARRIALANRERCPQQRPDYGMTAASPNRAAPAEAQAQWSAALGIAEQGSTVIAIYPHGPAEAAGLRVGDSIIAVNSVHWGQEEEGRKRFSTAISAGLKAAEVKLGIRREDHEFAANLTADMICDANIFLVPGDKVDASSQTSNIWISGAMEGLLPDDNELAFVIGHELAHIILGHVTADKTALLKQKGPRREMEMAADALGVRLAARAGYDPEAAARAHPRIAAASRGPISRLLDLHGSYQSTDDRIAYLRQQAEETRKEGEAPR